MGFGYWFKRSLKTTFCIAFYYCALFAGSVIFYPRGLFNDLSRGDKVSQSLVISVFLCYFLFSAIVIINRLLWKKTWFSSFSVLFSYFIFSISHFIFLFIMSQFAVVEWIPNLIIFVIGCIVSIILGLLVITKDKQVKFDEEDEFEEAIETI